MSSSFLAKLSNYCYFNKCKCKEYEKECICDLLSFSRKYTDWPIAKCVGSATYAQLLDAAPGLFEPFPDWRSDGNTASSLSRFSPNPFKTIKVPNSGEKEDEVPPPPNLISTILAEGYLTAPELKRLLIKASQGNGIDPRIETIIATSVPYSYPEMTLGEILITFILYSLIIGFVVGIIIRFNYSTGCKIIGGCPTYKTF